MNMASDILVVDDNTAIRLTMAKVLALYDYRCSSASCAADARALMKSMTFQAALIDIMMPGESGVDLLRWILENQPDTATIMVTGLDDPHIASTTTRLGAYGYLIKPIATSQLVVTLDNALRRRELEIANRSYVAQIELLVQARLGTLRAARDALGAFKTMLRKIDDHARSLIESERDPVFLASANGIVTHLNMRGRQVLGVTEADLTAGLSIAPVDGDLSTWLARRSPDGSASHHAVRFIRTDGASLDAVIALVEVPTAEHGAIVGTIHDVMADGRFAERREEPVVLLERVASDLVRCANPATVSSGAGFLSHSLGSVDELLDALGSFLDIAASGQNPIAEAKRLSMAASLAQSEALVTAVPDQVKVATRDLGQLCVAMLALRKLDEGAPGRATDRCDPSETVTPRP
jgi:DNA-binding response OmpR family regulator